MLFRSFIFKFIFNFSSVYLFIYLFFYVFSFLYFFVFSFLLLLILQFYLVFYFFYYVFILYFYSSSWSHFFAPFIFLPFNYLSFFTPRTDGSLSYLSTMKSLYFLNLSGNSIKHFSSFDILKSLKYLKILFLQSNPCCFKINFPSDVFKILTQIEKIDSWLVFFSYFLF